LEFSVGSVQRRSTQHVAARRRVPPSERPVARGQLLSDVFDALASGVLVVSVDRRILTWNPRLGELVGDSIGSAGTCCDVLGCRRPGSALEGICLTELAASRGAGRGTLQFELELPGRDHTPVEVTATLVPGARQATVLFEVRALADSGPPPAASQAPERLMIRALGETVVETAAGEVRGGWLDQRTGRLLKYLVAHRAAPVHSELIAEALWPRARADTTNTVRHFIHALRDKLEPERVRYEPSAFVIARNGGYQLNPQRVQIDAELFERQAQRGLRALEAGDHEAALEQLRAAIDMYRGDFLIDERFEDWAIAERERLLDLAGQVLRALARATADPAEAAMHLERLAEMVPLDADVQRELITTWMRQGRRTRALRRYRTLQSRLMREFGERISFDLGELARDTPDGPRA
jgi:DNA-binding SARP family transcriptional activator